MELVRQLRKRIWWKSGHNSVH